MRQNFEYMRKATLIIFLLSLGYGAIAQISIGYRAGLGNYGINLEPATLNKYQEPYQRFNHGFVFCYTNEGNAGIQVEVNYAQKGWQEYLSTAQDSFYRRNLDYIEIPIYSHFEMGYKKIRPFINVGPYFAWQINDSYTHYGFDDQLVSEAYVHYKQESNGFDFGLKISVGLRYNITNRLAIYGEATYDLEIAGGKDIFKDRPDDISASRLTETSGAFGVLWHIKPQKLKVNKKGYTPKEDLYDVEY